MAKLIYPPEDGTLYKCDYVINGRKIKRLIISNHYKKKHAKYMNDELIIELIETYLDGKRFEGGEKKGVWEYFAREPLIYQDKKYRLVWLFHENISDFLGIVNCCYSNAKIVNYEEN